MPELVPHSTPTPPPQWERMEGFRSTFLLHFPIPHADALQRVAQLLYDLVLDSPPDPERIEDIPWTRWELSAALTELKFIESYLMSVFQEHKVSSLPPDVAKLSKLAGGIAGDLSRVIEEFEGVLAKWLASAQSSELHGPGHHGAVYCLETGRRSSWACFRGDLDRGSRRSLPRCLETSREAAPACLESVWLVQGAFDGRSGDRGPRPHLPAVRDLPRRCQGTRRLGLWAPFPGLHPVIESSGDHEDGGPLQGAGGGVEPLMGAMGREGTDRRSRTGCGAVPAGRLLAVSL